MKERGILYGVGVGPGDAELVTLKALRVMRACDLLILPEADRENCRAWQIARAACPELTDKAVLGFSFPMTRDRARRDAALAEIWRELAALLDAGKVLAFLTIGDPGVYSTFSYMSERAQRDGYRTAVVPGVPSFAACAASLSLPLVLDREALHLIPGSEDLESALALPGTKVFMKLGTCMPALKEALLAAEEAGRFTVTAVSDCGPQELCFRGAEALPEDAPYMTTVIVKDREA